MKKYTHSLIFLHGFSMEAKDMIYYSNKIDKILPENIKFKYIFPQAYKKKITCFDGEKDAAWYDYFTSNIKTEEEINEADLIKSRNRIHKLILKEKTYHNNDTTKIFVGGYSQGCCQALDAGITFPEKLGGIIGFKGHIVNYTFNYIKIPQFIWVIHGKKDDTISYNVSKTSYDKYNKKYITFLSQNSDHEMHTGIKDQMLSLNKWLLKRL